MLTGFFWEGGIPEGQRLSGRPRSGWENNSKRVKGKSIPLQAWIGPKGCKRLRLPDFKTIGT